MPDMKLPSYFYGDEAMQFTVTRGIGQEHKTLGRDLKNPFSIYLRADE